MEQSPPINPAIVYEPDGYRTDVERLMGRQAAGNGFLRAAVAAALGRPLAGYTVRKSSAESFDRTVKEIDPAAKAAWLPPGRPDLLQQVGHLYLPGPGLGDFARQRLRFGPAAWSLTGVTHTTASHIVMGALADLLVAPVMPWDALVCTSQAVLKTVNVVADAQWDYLQWKFGTPTKPALPQLPVIPLGVHCRDFETTAQQRAAARQALGIADDEVAYLFVGRLSFHAKAHPAAMYEGLQAAAKRTGRKLVLVQCGWFANDSIEDAFRAGAAQLCPDVRCLFTDGRAGPARRNSWGAADVFVSLSDNIQETFGLTPIEAMAAGLPVVVTDWDGYKDTVRDGIDGFRVATTAPGPGGGEHLAYSHETGQDNYDVYCGLTCLHVGVDHAMLADRLAVLAQDPGLRRRLGDAGAQRAREVYDWAVVYRAYQSLWGELERLRKAAPQASAPRIDPARLDPFLTFGHYPTHAMGPGTRIRRRNESSPEAYAQLARTGLFSYADRHLPPNELALRAWHALGSEAMTIAALAESLKLHQVQAIRAVAVFAKLGLVEVLS
ncbi:MAG: glycosyltransferase family 4 protein [Burkholderiales bacterium]|nr:glycosyltransferase family 4 protein [Burkholderiales bacterium]